MLDVSNKENKMRKKIPYKLFRNRRFVLNKMFGEMLQNLICKRRPIDSFCCSFLVTDKEKSKVGQDEKQKTMYFINKT